MIDQEVDRQMNFINEIMKDFYKLIDSKLRDNIKHRVRESIITGDLANELNKIAGLDLATLQKLYDFSSVAEDNAEVVASIEDINKIVSGLEKETESLGKLNDNRLNNLENKDG